MIGTLRGPNRKVPPEEVEAIRRSVASGRPAREVAAEHGIAVRTVWRYVADPDGIRARRIRVAVEGWPRVHLLTTDDRESLVRWLTEVEERWVD